MWRAPTRAAAALTSRLRCATRTPWPRPCHAPLRTLCTTTPPAQPPPSPEPHAPVKIYRLHGITLLRALLRVKVLQLGGGVAVVLPSAAIISNGGLPSFAEGALVAGVVGGTLVAGATLSWYAERIVGEIAWLPGSRELRVSTLTMWGERFDRHLSLDELRSDGLAVPAPPPPGSGEPNGAYPEPGFAPLQLCGQTYVCVWGQRHVLQAEAMARLLKRDELPFDPDRPLPGAAQPARATEDSKAAQPQQEASSSQDADEHVRFF